MSSKKDNTERLKRNAKKRSSDGPSTSFAMNSIFNSENEFESEISTLEKSNVLQNISFNLSGEEQVNQNSVYTIIPTKGLFNDDRELFDFTELIMQSLEEQCPNQPAILKSASDVNGLKIKFNQTPLKKQHFTQFSYQSPIRLGVITNMYGAFVNSLDQRSPNPIRAIARGQLHNLPDVRIRTSVAYSLDHTTSLNLSFVRTPICLLSRAYYLIGPLACSHACRHTH